MAASSAAIGRRRGGGFLGGGRRRRRGGGGFLGGGRRRRRGGGGFLGGGWRRRDGGPPLFGRRRRRCGRRRLRGERRRRRWGGGGCRQGGGGGDRDAAGVVGGGDGLQTAAGGVGQPAVAAVQQFGERGDGAFADGGELVVEAVQQLAWQRRRGVPARAGDVQLALQMAEHVRPLVRGDLADLVADVVIELAHGDPVVLVAVGLAGLQRLHDGGREHRRAALAGQLVALERILHRVGGGDDRPAAPAQVVIDVDVVAGAEAQAARDRAAVAAVEQHQHVVRAAARHRPRHELGGNRGRVQVRDLGVGGREVQLPAVVLEPVAREVQQQQLVATAVAEERRDPATQDRVRLVQGRGDLELADLGVPQDLRQRRGVPRGRAQPAQLRVRVGVGRDDQRKPSRHRALTPRAPSGRSRSSGAGTRPIRR